MISIKNKNTQPIGKGFRAGSFDRTWPMNALIYVWNNSTDSRMKRQKFRNNSEGSKFIFTTLWTGAHVVYKGRGQQKPKTVQLQHCKKQQFVSVATLVIVRCPFFFSALNGDWSCNRLFFFITTTKKILASEDFNKSSSEERKLQIRSHFSLADTWSVAFAPRVGQA